MKRQRQKDRTENRAESIDTPHYFSSHTHLLDLMQHQFANHLEEKYAHDVIEMAQKVTLEKMVIEVIDSMWKYKVRTVCQQLLPLLYQPEIKKEKVKFCMKRNGKINK
jgi:hypothetical protein